MSDLPLTRRATLATGLGALCAAALPAAPAFSKAPLATTPAPTLNRFKLGDFEITALYDGDLARPLDATFVRNAPLESVQKALTDNFLPTDKLLLTFTALLVNTGSKLVLIDTGFADNGPPSTGRVASAIRAAGYKPEDVDTVLISHFHGDHLNGARLKDGTLAYPNAEIVVPEGEWAFWMDDAKASAAPEGMKGNFAMVKRVLGPNAKDVRRFAWGAEVAPGITAVEAAGHTPGHTAFALQSGNAKMMYVADITNNPLLFATNPEWKVMFDMDADKAVATRKRILDMASAERMRLSFYHAPFPATGFMSREGGGYRFNAAPWG